MKDIEVRRTEEAISAILTSGAGKAKTMTPISTSNLINSQYAPQIEQGQGKTTGHIGYTASYAGAVHGIENPSSGRPRPNGNGNFWDPNAEPEFLAKGFEEIKPQIPAILARIYKV
ncbi:hypothetical protein ACMSSJ_13820 [Kerstersia gyiorum]|uniref:hypothetical protein n=1 Tax=Kerstersia gyiorum TaxID=206506 RepID=UPI0039EB957A